MLFEGEAEFLSTLQRRGAAFFDASAPLWIGRAPGRIDVMGGIADYSGSLVLQWPLARATFAAVQRTDDAELSILSLGERERSFEVAMADWIGRREGSARAWFAKRPGDRWAGYVAGALVVLARSLGVSFDGGVRILISSAVPPGAGVASSAALEVASMTALSAAFGVEMDARALALLCQRVENDIVGAACGVMDQLTAACGEAGALLELLCRPAELRGAHFLPPELEICGVDSGERHSVAGDAYTDVRIGTFIGRRMLGIDGYLADIDPVTFECDLAARLPDAVLGSEFLAEFGSSGDAATRVNPKRRYAVRAPARHPIHENHRVRAFAALLRQPPSEARHRFLGELMFQSHAAMSAVGLGSAATDQLVALARREADVYGAKITGGGCGGTVALLVRRDSDAVERISTRFQRDSGASATLFRGSSPGAGGFGARRHSLR